MSARQLPIEYDRASKLRMLESVTIAVESGRKTSQVSMKAILKVIDAHARDKPSAILKIATIAVESGLSRDATKFAIKELERQFLLQVTRRTKGTGKRASEYKVVWPNLRALLAGETSNEPMVNGSPSDGEWSTIGWGTVHRPIVNGSPSYEAQLSKRPFVAPSNERFDDEDSSFEESNVGHAAALARRWAPVLQPRSHADKDNLAKIALLVANGQIEEAEPSRIIEAMISPQRDKPVRKTMGYFMDSLANNLREKDRNLTALMRSVTLSRRISV